MRVARAHAGRASRHSTPAACRPPNSADGSHLTYRSCRRRPYTQTPTAASHARRMWAWHEKLAMGIALKATARPNELSLGAVRAQARVILCSGSSCMAPALSHSPRAAHTGISPREPSVRPQPHRSACPPLRRRRAVTAQCHRRRRVPRLAASPSCDPRLPALPSFPSRSSFKR